MMLYCWPSRVMESLENCSGLEFRYYSSSVVIPLNSGFFRKNIRSQSEFYSSKQIVFNDTGYAYSDWFSSRSISWWSFSPCLLYIWSGADASSSGCGESLINMGEDGGCSFRFWLSKLLAGWNIFLLNSVWLTLIALKQKCMTYFILAFHQIMGSPLSFLAIYRRALANCGY